MTQLILHLLGDFIIQTDTMALNKKSYTLKGWIACLSHCITYAIPFLLITNWKIVILIGITHLIFDKTNLITYLLSLKNRCKTDNFGFSPKTPAFITIWLNIITDNSVHLLINYLLIIYISKFL